MANPTDREMLKIAQSGAVNSSPFAASPDIVVKALHTKYYQFLVQDAATAGTAVTKTSIHMPVRGKVVSVSMTAPIAVTASDTNYATLTVSKETAGSATTVAAQTTKVTGGAGSLVAFVPYKFTATQITGSAVQMAADDTLSIAIAKAASGVALTAATSYFTVCVGVEEN